MNDFCVLLSPLGVQLTPKHRACTQQSCPSKLGPQQTPCPGAGHSDPTASWSPHPSGPGRTCTPPGRCPRSMWHLAAPVPRLARGSGLRRELSQKGSDGKRYQDHPEEEFLEWLPRVKLQGGETTLSEVGERMFLLIVVTCSLLPEHRNVCT